jgi:large subunit ribosomal protein L32e
MAVTPLIKHKKILKRTKRFTRFEYEDFNGKLSPSWRRPRGIDNRVRRQYRGNKPLVKCGYGQALKTKYLLPNGFKKFLIRNSQDLELLLMNNRVYAGELAHNLSAKTRKQIVLRAAELNVRLTNAKGKLVKEEKKN